MREILFRGKRADNGEWIQGKNIHYVYVDGDDELKCAIHPSGETFIHIENGFIQYRPFLVNTKTVGQFTGLLDKRGRKIFEGDKVKIAQGAGFVEWSKTQCKFVIWIPKSNKFVPLSADTSYEVIGNIHDNPEVMEVAR